MKNRHRVSQAVSKLICSRAAGRKILKRVRRIAPNIAMLGASKCRLGPSRGTAQPRRPLARDIFSRSLTNIRDRGLGVRTRIDLHQRVQCFSLSLSPRLESQSVSAGSKSNSHLCSNGGVLTANSRRAAPRPIHRSFWMRRARSRGNGCAWRVISSDLKLTGN
jgi:hypothetical protein